MIVAIVALERLAVALRAVFLLRQDLEGGILRRANVALDVKHFDLRCQAHGGLGRRARSGDADRRATDIPRCADGRRADRRATVAAGPWRHRDRGARESAA